MRIFVHSGKSHLDEIISILEILHINKITNFDDIEIIRLERNEVETAKENMTKDDIMLDVGMELDWDKMIVDHHHDKNLPATCKIIFDKYYEYLKDSDLAKMIDKISRIDTKGPHDIFNNDIELVDLFYFPITFITRNFEVNPLETIKMLYPVWIEMITFEHAKEKAKTVLYNSDLIKKIKIKNYTILDVNDVVMIYNLDGRAFNAAQKKYIDENNIDLVISINPQDKNMTVYRTHRNKDIDLNILRNHIKDEDIVFIHPNGFIAKLNVKIYETIYDILNGALEAV